MPVVGVSFSWEKASKNAAPSGSITRAKGACQPVRQSVSRAPCVVALLVSLAVAQSALVALL